MRIARAHSMHFIVLAILISFLRVSLHHSLMERNLIGVLMIDHFLFFLQAPDREECARSPKPFSRAQGACGRKAPSSVKGLWLLRSFALRALVWLPPILYSYNESDIPALG